MMQNGVQTADTIKERSEIWQNIDVSDGCLKKTEFDISEDKLYVLCSCGIGDTLFAASLISSYKKYFRESRKVYLLVKENQGISVTFVIGKGALTYKEKVNYTNANTMVREEIMRYIVRVSGELVLEVTTVKERKGLSFVGVKCFIRARENLGCPTTTARENKERFMEYLKAGSDV